MRIAMVYPSRDSEKAISGYSSTLAESMRKQGINVVDFHYFAGKPTTLFKKLKKLSKYDIIHIQHEYNLLKNYGLPFFLTYFYLGLLKKGKLITTMHTVLSLKERFREKKVKTFFRKTLYYLQNKFIKFSSDKIVVHAKFFKEILVSDYGFNKKKIEVLPQGIIEDVKTLSKKEARKKFNLKGKVYLFMGSMVPDHGHDIIIKQANKIGKTILVVANPSSVSTDRNPNRIKNYLEENREYVKKKKFENFVRFDILPITDKMSEWWEYFSAADLILLPYRGGIGSGIFAHAMAMEKPVIASNIKYFDEISKEYRCIKTAKNNEDFPKIISDSMKTKNYIKMVSECKRYKSKNNLSSISKKYKELYSSLN